MTQIYVGQDGILRLIVNRPGRVSHNSTGRLTTGRRIPSCPTLVATLLLGALNAPAQWFNYPTAGIPRTPDSKPKLTAPTPKAADGKPDLSGLWKAPNGKYLLDLAADLKPDGAPFLPWAAAVYKQRVETLGRERPPAWCIPHGVPDSMPLSRYPLKTLHPPLA